MLAGPGARLLNALLACHAASLRISQGRCDSSRAEPEETVRPVVSHVKRHCRAQSRRAAGGVCQHTPSGLVAGRKLKRWRVLDSSPSPPQSLRLSPTGTMLQSSIVWGHCWRAAKMGRRSQT